MVIIEITNVEEILSAKIGSFIKSPMVGLNIVKPNLILVVTVKGNGNEA